VKPFNKQDNQEIMHKENRPYLHTPQGPKTNKNFVYRMEDEALKISGYK
jgi:hypothetical protein